MPSLPARLPNILFGLFIAGILAYGAGLAGYLLLKFDLLNLIRDVNLDDSFYYFQLAHHLSEGRFSTFDGGVTQTNGYHPIWLLLITPLFWFLDKEAALFAIKALEIMLIAGAVALIAVAARLARLPWYLLFALLPLLYRQPAVFLGVEAAAALFMLGLLFLTLVLYARDPQRWTWPLTAVVFALPWVRLEYMAVSLAAAGALVFIRSPRREPAGASERASNNSTPPPPKLRTFVPLAGAIAGILVYFAYSWLIFDGIVPVSGATKLALSRFRWEQDGGYSLVQNFRDMLQVRVFDSELLVALGVCVCLPIVWRWGVRRIQTRDDWLLLVFLAGVFGLAAGHLAKFVQSVLTTHPAYAAYAWYFVPVYLLLTLTVPVICWSAIYCTRSCLASRPRAARVLSAGIVLAGAVLLLARTDFTEQFRYIDRAGEAADRDWELASYMGALVMDRLLPEECVVGSWDAGVIGYFSDCQVVNLDGLVNSWDYYRETDIDRHGYPRYGERLIPLYRGFGITHFANVERRGYYGPFLFYGPQYGDGRDFYLWPAEPMEQGDAGSWFWERMGPHFDYRTDDAAVVVDGRLALAFTPDCRPGEQVVLEWAGTENGRLSAPLLPTGNGACTGAAVSLYDPLPPYRIERVLPKPLTAAIRTPQPAIQAFFNVYLTGDRLVYVRERCEPADTEAQFFVHLTPVDVNDLSADRRSYGFDALGFHFTENGRETGAACLAIRDLPGYPIAAIRTGQFVRTGSGVRDLWQGEIRLW